MVKKQLDSSVESMLSYLEILCRTEKTIDLDDEKTVEIYDAVSQSVSHLEYAMDDIDEQLKYVIAKAVDELVLDDQIDASNLLLFLEIRLC